MLCVWGPREIMYKKPYSSVADGKYEELNYVNSDGTVETPFYTDINEDDRDIVAFGEPIAITGNMNGQFLIAYETEDNTMEDEPALMKYLHLLLPYLTVVPQQSNNGATVYSL